MLQQESQVRFYKFQVSIQIGCERQIWAVCYGFGTEKPMGASISSPLLRVGGGFLNRSRSKRVFRLHLVWQCNTQNPNNGIDYLTTPST